MKKWYAFHLYLHSHKYCMYSYYIHTYVCMYVRMYVCMHICNYMRILYIRILRADLCISMYVYDL